MQGDVRVAATAEKGRHLIAERGFQPGDVVLTQAPYAAVLFNANVPHVCNYCFRPGSNLQRCSRSKFAHYCSREHQLKDWKQGYKLECDFLVHCAPRVPPASIRLAAQVAWKLKRELESGIAQEDFWNSFAGVEALVDHWDDLPSERMTSFAQMGYFITKICPHLPEEGLSLDEPLAKSFAKLLAKFAFNNHTISSAAVTNLGCGVYPLLAMANHSSWPNCIQHFNGKICEFRAIQPIQAGDELTITYVDLLNTSLEVHEILKKDYLFDWIPQMKEPRHVQSIHVNQTLSVKLWKKEVPRWMLNEKDVALTRVLGDGGDPVGGAMVMVYEEGPPEPTEWEERSESTASKQLQRVMTVHLWGEWATKRGFDAKGIAQQLQQLEETYLKGEDLYTQQDYQGSLLQAQKCQQLLSKGLQSGCSLAETHILPIRVLDLLRKALVDSGSDWKLTLECYKKLVAKHDLLYPHFWSERGSQLAAMARLQSNYGDEKEAIQTCERAIHVLRVTDGSGEVLEEMKKLETNLHHEINLREQPDVELDT